MINITIFISNIAETITSIATSREDVIIT